MTNDFTGGGMVEFEAPIVDFVKFAGQVLVYLENGKTYVSSDGMRYDQATITIIKDRPTQT